MTSPTPVLASAPAERAAPAPAEHAAPAPAEHAAPAPAERAAPAAVDPGAALSGTEPEAADRHAEFVIAGERGLLPRSMAWAPHRHSVHELLWVRRGSMSVTAGHRVWMLPAGIGVWMPAGIVHAGTAAAGSDFHASFFTPRTARPGPVVCSPEPVALEITPLLEGLLEHLLADDLTAGARQRAEAVVFDLLRPSHRPWGWVVPDDPRIGDLVRALIDDPGDRRSLQEWAEAAGLSSRTLARAFSASAGVSFTRWRSMLRVYRAQQLLGEGVSVADVAEAVGYDTTSAFIEAFRAVVGRSPGSYRSMLV
ncbi:helix-turn-helix domain-containing protein [Polymorphospora rubra]|uniref:helix-turn-helix domain-containing protein n=1 Tax=Polymorphospora rubra TaxID=338584 RepID=UPI0033E7A7DF